MENTNPFQRQNDFEMSVRGGMKAAGEDVSQDITDNEDKTYSIRHLILDYCEYTSGHGPPRIIASKQTIRKIFWTLLFLAALAMSSWQINTLFNTYKARPLSTHVSIKHETVCISLAYPGSKFFNSTEDASSDFVIIESKPNFMHLSYH